MQESGLAGIRRKMADWLSRKQRSRNMASIRSAGNKSTEEAFLKLLRSSKISGWRRHLPLPGKPDFSFPRQRIAIFIDGCFWHGCPRCYRLPEDNRPYWKKKLARNKERDGQITGEFRARGWKVLRIWEHCLENAAGRSAVSLRVARLLSNATSRVAVSGRKKR
jgi:DNA mismatch endonuclease, patch repair protein